MRRWLARLGLFLVIGACTSPSEPVARGVTLVPTATVYAPGATISAVLANASDVGFTYGACHPSLERRVGPQWLPAGEDPRLCSGILRAVPPRSSSTVTFQLSPNVVADSYRLRLDLSLGTDGRLRVVRSPRFSVALPE